MENVDARRESVSSEVLVPSSPAPCLPPSLFGVFTKLVGGHQREALIFSILGDRLNQPLSPCLLLSICMLSIFWNIISHPLFHGRWGWKGSWGSCSSTPHLSGKGTPRPARVKGPGQVCTDSEGQSWLKPIFLGCLMSCASPVLTFGYKDKLGWGKWAPNSLFHVLHIWVLMFVTFQW